MAGNGTQAEGPPQMPVPLLMIPVFQQFQVEGGDMGGERMILLRMLTPQVTAQLVLNADAARALIKQISEQLGDRSGLQVVQDPRDVERIVRPSDPQP